MRNIAFALIASTLTACQTTPANPISYQSGVEAMQLEITIRDLKAADRVCGGDELCIFDQQEAKSRLQSVWNATYNSVRIGRGRNAVDVTPIEDAERDLKVRTIYGASVAKATNEDGDVDWIAAERNLIAGMIEARISFTMCAAREGWRVYTFKCPKMVIYRAGAEGAGPVSNSPNDFDFSEMKIAKPIAGESK